MSALCWCGQQEQSKQKAAALPWLCAPLPALETIDHLTSKAFPAWVYSALQSSSSWDVNSSPSNKSWAGRFGLVQFSPPFAAALGAALEGPLGCSGMPRCRAPLLAGPCCSECAAVPPRPAEGSRGLAESAARGRMRAEKEKQRRGVVCSELSAEIISVWVSGLGLDGAVGDLATFPGRGKSHVSGWGEVPCERGSRSWSGSPGFSRGGKALLWRAHPTCGSALPPHGAEPWRSAGGSPPAPPRGLHPSLGAPKDAVGVVHPKLGHCCAPQWDNLLCGVPGQG